MTSRSSPPRRPPASSASPRGRPCPGTRSATACSTTSHTVNHVRLGHEAELIVVAPATADLLARAATGQADDLLTNTLLMAGDCPVLMAPAMHTEMWQHPATQANVETLRSRGVTVLEPASGRLTGADSGPGRLPEPEAIFTAAMALAGATAATAAACWPAPAAAGRRSCRHRSGAAASVGRAHRHRQRRRHPRTAGPRPVPRQPLLRQAGRGPGRGRPRRRRPGPPAGRPHGRPGARRRRARPGRDRPGAARRRRCTRPPTPTSSSWPPPSRTSARRTCPAPRSRSATTSPIP